jgi:hypothetical protein
MGCGLGSLRRDRDELDGPADGPEVRVTLAWPERRAGDGNRARTTSLEGHVRHGAHQEFQPDNQRKQDF